RRAWIRDVSASAMSMDADASISEDPAQASFVDGRISTAATSEQSLILIRSVLCKSNEIVLRGALGQGRCCSQEVQLRALPCTVSEPRHPERLKAAIACR